jgi:hypothetical protein
MTVSAANSRTAGLVRMRWVSPESISSESSSDGSSDAWWLPDVPRSVDLDSAEAAHSASTRSDRPGGRSARSRA